MANVERKIRKRNPNWDDVEKRILRKCLEKTMGIIENKCTDTNTNIQKHLAWQKVLQRFNELNGRQRSLAEVKLQWRSMKIVAQKCHNSKKADQTVTIEVSDEDSMLNKEAIENLESESLVSTTVSSKRPLLNKSSFSLPIKRKCNPDEPNLLPTVKERNAVLTNVIENESNLKIKHMIEAHEWAREEHQLKIENLIFKNTLLTKQILKLNK